MEVWVVIYAIGAAQAAMLAFALRRRRANVQANRVLSLWLAIIAADLAVKALHLASPGGDFAGAFRFARLLPFVYAPMFYVYVRALTDGRGLGRGDLRHAAWFLLVLLWAAGRWLSGAGLSADGSWHWTWFDPLLFSVAVAYLVAAVLRLRRYRRWLRQRRSDADRLSLRWIMAMAACQFAIWGIAATHWLARVPGIDYFLIYGAVAAWVCVVGWFSLAQPPVAEPIEVTQEAARPPVAATAPAAADDPRFDEVEARLSALMSGEAMYREPALSIAQLARRSGYPEYLVSATINRRSGGNFWEYVNRHRIEAARERLADAGDARTILDIAYDAGFTSKSTFNAAFKRLVGETPSAYRRRHAAPPGPPPA